MGEHSLSGYGPIDLVNRPVRTRMPGGVGAGGEKPPATRLDLIYIILANDHILHNKFYCQLPQEIALCQK